MDSKHWEIKYKKSADSTKDVVDILLENRGFGTVKQKKDFLNPKKPESLTPKDFGIDDKKLQKAFKRIKKAIKSNERIIVFGDYDADGVCATAIMWEALHKMGANALPFIPDRFEDGYGLSAQSIKKLKDKHKDLKLIITVDNGIVANDAVEVSNNLGIDVIITDHHTTGKKLPNAFAIVHTTKTSGSGISWFFARELAGAAALELAAIGTVSDQLPLVGINRSIVKYGISALNNTARIGLRKLFATAALVGKPIGTYEINFVIAPRINATGRIAKGMDALRLLCTTNELRAQKLSLKLDQLNLERQSMVADALALADKNINTENSIIILSHTDFHEGIIGLIASKMVEKYYRPTIVFSEKGKTSKASARSISGFSIIDAIRAIEGFDIDGGGHSMAAGFSLATADIGNFSEAINTYSEPMIDEQMKTKKLKIDMELQFNLLNQNFYNELSALEPYGIGNPEPVFLTKSAEVVDQKLVGKEKKHLKLNFQKGGQSIGAIAFNWAEGIKSSTVDVVYRLKLNEWNGRSSIELFVRDIKENV